MRLSQFILIMGVLLYVCYSLSFATVKAACGGPNDPACTPAERLGEDFIPNVTRQELQRAVTVGNPPRRSMLLPSTVPLWFSRPPEIPRAFPLRNQNGERFVQ